jgi:AraC family transcriptional regulator
MTSPVEKALWYVESHFADAITLEDIARASGVSRFHLVRAFAAAIGQPVMRHVRGRRLSEAARRLAAGAPDILAVALDAGYGSHEAFTRAFRDQFGLTPEGLRAIGRLDAIQLVEPLTMSDETLVTLDPPRVTDAPAMLVAGLGARYAGTDSRAIPGLWQSFSRHIGSIPGQIGFTTYGVCFNTDDEGNFDYIAGVEVKDFSDLPAEFARVRIPAHRYAVFTHRDHISAIRRTFHTIWSKGLQEAGHAAADAPLFEKYSESFDPQTGTGGLEIWIPIKD